MVVVICAAVTVAVSYVTKPKPDKELKGLVYGLTKIPSGCHFPIYKRSTSAGVAVANPWSSQRHFFGEGGAMTKHHPFSIWSVIGLLFQLVTA